MAKLSIRSLGASAVFTLGAMAASGAECGARADVIYVDDSATAGANTGESWPDAFTDLQSALAIAKEFDEIRVAQGTYKPAPPGGDRTISFNLVSGTILQGGYAGFGASDPDALDHEMFQTFLSGSLGTGSSYHVVAGNDLVKGTAVRGLRIVGGSADETEPPHNRGAGMRLTDCRLVVADCHIGLNYAFSGAAGVHSLGGLVRFERCTFQSNWGSYPISSSAGALASNSSVAIDCLFVGNSAGQAAGAATGNVFSSCTFVGNYAEDGGAISGASVVIHCLFESNHALFGGAMRGGGFIANCIFRRNSAGDEGGALDNPGRIVNCAFIGNRCSGQGGGAISYFYFSTQTRTIRNSTFEGNRATGLSTEGAAIHSRNGIINAGNCIFWNNSTLDSSGQDAQFSLEAAAAIIPQNTCVRGWTGSLGGIGNHGNDPRFVDADGPDNIYGTPDDDPRLRPNSPCIDSGDATLLPPDEFDLDDDGDVTEPLPIDLDGLPRVVGANLDMGAFEFQGIPCRADINGDASVEFDDLRAVISSWGPCTPGEECNADLNLDFTVSIDDLLAVISAWGPCS